MYEKTISRFKKLPEVTKSMIFIFWVYEFVQTIVHVFLNIYVFLETGDLMSLVIYNFVFITGIAIGFWVWGIIVAQKQLSMRFNYLKSFVIYFLSFMLLLFATKSFSVLLGFALLNGLALGIFWLGVHTFEMLFVTDKDRDFYSSMVSAGGQIFKVLSPAISVLLFWVSKDVLGKDPFFLLFIVLPFVYLLAIPFLFKLPDFTPPKILKSDWKYLRENKKLKNVRSYVFWTGFDWSIFSIILPIIAIGVLGNVINVGIFETLVGFLAFISIVVLSHTRHAGNRITILKRSSYGMLFGVICLSLYHQSIYFYIAYSLIFIFLMPIFRVSHHVLDLKSIDLFKGTRDHFYPGLLYRDFILYVCRVFVTVSIGTFYWLSGNIGNNARTFGGMWTGHSLGCVGLNFFNRFFAERDGIGRANIQTGRATGAKALLYYDTRIILLDGVTMADFRT